MKQLNGLVALLLGLFIGIFSNGIFAQEASSETPQYLFVMTSDIGELEYNKETKKYELIVEDTYPWVTYFSISPDKKTGFVPLEKFPKIFNQIDVEKNHEGLNSALVAKPLDKNDISTYALTLIDMKYEKKKNIIRFIAKILPGKKVEKLPHTAKFKHIALFIDEGCASCGGSGI